MGRSVAVLVLAALVLCLPADAAPAGHLIKHLASVIKWSRSVTKSPHSDGNYLQFEDGYLVETVVEGNDLGMVPYAIRVSQDGELYAVDEVNSNIVKITPPLSQYSRARLVAGSFQGYTGHVDGKPSEARFNKPKGVTMDDKGNVYVADTVNMAIRKIGDSGVTTIAGGKSNVAGFRDGPSEDAKFSNDFDVVYVRPTCSLLVVDRGNAALRQIALDQEDCDYESNSITLSDILLVIGAILVGYATCVLQQGFGPTGFTRAQQLTETAYQAAPLDKEKSFTPVVESVKDEPIAGWPSFGQLIIDLAKLALEALTSASVNLVPSLFRRGSSKRGLDPFKDRLKMPEDEAEPQLVHKQRTPAPVSERLILTAEKFSDSKPMKVRSSSFKDPSLSTKHRSSKRQEFEEFYGSAEAASLAQARPKSQKDRTRHRQREKSGEVTYGAAAAAGVGAETKPAEMKPINYDEPKFSHYNFRSKYGSTLPSGFD
uniref:NHL repeat-containing protein n=1 Tax=Kalanchoe fedtschenkoi TaxID=63787 RepID=A0A7N1A8Y2_KALFE